MDIHDLWQEHKRWILGVAIGCVAFWIGMQVVDSMYDNDRARREIARTVLNVSREEFYSQAALRELESERQALRAAEQRLRTAIEYRPEDEFVLAGKGVPDLHFHQVSRRVRRTLRDAADRAGIELLDKDLEWPTPSDREGIQSTLTGLGLLEDAMLRLVAVHERVITEHHDALGVRSIDKFAVVPKLGIARTRGTRRRSADPGAALGIREESVTFAFRADARTAQAFLEACRAADRPVVLDPGFTIKQAGKQPGDPVLVQGQLTAITFPVREEDA